MLWMDSFYQALTEGRLLFDGSMGALLSSMGHQSDCPELYTVERPEVIRDVHRRYKDAGANVMIACSLGATPIKLQHKGISERAAELSRAAVSVAREVAGDTAYVAFDLGPCGEFMQPVGELTFEEAVQNFRVALEAAKEAGADFALLETMTDIAECRAACIAAREASLPVVASFTFEKNDRTLTGGTPECAALSLWAAGACAMGINCSGGPEEMIAPLRAMRLVSPLPVVVQPNAGLPTVDENGKAVYTFTPESMLPLMADIIEEGAAAIGGCCGTTPKHIKAFAGLEKKPFVSGWDGEERICSARNAVVKAEAREAMAEIDDLEDLYDLEKEDLCAVLDLTGLSAAKAADYVEEAQSMTKIPLVLRADNKEALVAALRVYTGMAGVIAGDEIVKGLPYRVVRFEG